MGPAKVTSTICWSRMFGGYLLTLAIMLFIEVTHVMAKHVKEASSEELVNIIFAGDISFDGTVRYHVNKGDHTYNDSFSQIAPYITDADLAVVNFESPIITKKMRKWKVEKGPYSMLLRADAKSASSLSYAGFDVVSLANNHMNDYGDKHVNFTVKSLNDAGIKTFGINYGPAFSPQEPFITEAKGVKLGFLAYCLVVLNGIGAPNCEQLRRRYDAGPAPYRHDVATKDIKTLKDRVDVIVVFMHWGKEYYLKPIKSQVQIAKQLRSLGAHVIIGCHPHVLQKHCYHDNQVVAFSLGNFLFPWHVPGNVYFKRKKTRMEMEYYEKSIMSCTPPTKASQLFRVWVNKKGVVKADYLPLSIEFNPSIKCMQPKPIKGAKWIEVCGPNDDACTKCP